MSSDVPVININYPVDLNFGLMIGLGNQFDVRNKMANLGAAYLQMTATVSPVI